MRFVIGLVVIFLLLVVMWYISTYNKIKVLQLKVQEALSGIDVALTKRYDVLNKMVNVVKSYQKYEKELLTELVNVRMGASIQEKSEANAQMDALKDRINLIVENYPDLKSSANVIELQKAIVDVEEHLQAARRLYNANVTKYNASIVMFPNNYIAEQLGAKQEAFFVADEIKRNDVDVSLM